MDTRTKPRSFFDALEAHSVAKAAMTRATQPLPDATMEPHQHCEVHGFDIALHQDNAPRAVWLAHYDTGSWLEPHQALEIAAKLQSYANQSIVLRAQAAIAATERKP